MARRPTRKGGSKRSFKLRMAIYLVGFVLLCALAYSVWFWWEMRTWRPSEDAYPEQGAVIGSGVDGVRFETLKALGAQFVYLELRDANLRPDPNLAERMRSAQEAGLKIGIIQPFNPCDRADPQSARFTRMVARDADLLPPVISMVYSGDECRDPVSNAAVKSELLTLVNQIEMHAGRAAILKPSPEFEAQYASARLIDRDIWLERDRMQPNYAGRPWLLWTANKHMVTQATQEPIEWVVIQK